MWISWLVANRKDPGRIALNSDTYYRAIKQIPYFDKWKKRNIILSRLCHSCRCLRPLRAKHCRICNRCVSYFDHHCKYLYFFASFGGVSKEFPLFQAHSSTIV